MTNNSDKVSEILDNIKVYKDINIREIYDEAVLHYVDEQPIEIKEYNMYRVLVNNIRHSHTNYEDNLKDVYKAGSNNKYYPMYKNQVLKEISNQYPYLKEECDKQKRREIIAKKIK